MSESGELFKSSFARALGNTSFNHDFIESFYKHFLSQSEEISNAFKHTNMSAQKTMLHDSLNLMVDYYLSKTPPLGLQHMAEIHSRGQKDISPHLYETWLASLLETVKEFDLQFDLAIETAWREVLRPGIEYMRSVY